MGRYQPSVIPTLFCSQLRDWHKVAEVMINPQMFCLLFQIAKPQAVKEKMFR